MPCSVPRPAVSGPTTSDTYPRYTAQPPGVALSDNYDHRSFGKRNINLLERAVALRPEHAGIPADMDGVVSRGWRRERAREGTQS